MLLKINIREWLGKLNSKKNIIIIINKLIKDKVVHLGFLE